MQINFPYLMSDRDRHENLRYYVRRNGRKVRLREKLGTEAFAQAYADALRALDPSANRETKTFKHASAGTLGWVAANYFSSVEFRRLDPISQRTRRVVIEDCLREPRKPGVDDLMRDCPVNVVSAAHIKMLRDRKAETPGSANNRRKWLSAMFGWAVENNFMRMNPAREIRRIRYATDGFHPWTVDEVRRFEERHPVGSQARLALALLLYLGVRRGDVVTLGRQHVKDGWLRMVPRKTRHKRRELSEKPILPVLADVIARSPVGDLTFLVTKYGKPFTANGFGNWFRDRCNEAGLYHCTAHGLRKAGATLAAENGATDRQLMALFDWSSEKQANVYTATANRKRLAEEAAKHLAGGSESEQKVPHRVSHLEDSLSNTKTSESGGGPGRTRTSNQAVMSELN
jgi:integrase